MGQRTLIRASALPVWKWALLVMVALLPSSACGSELSVHLERGLEQRRNFERPGHWSRQWVRSLPPDNAPYLLVVQGPDEWLDEKKPGPSEKEIAALNEEHAAVVCAAMTKHDLLTPTEPVLLAARVVALVRPVELDEPAPGSRVHLWPLWRVLLDSQEADTLSVAVAAVQILDRAGVQARIARYPAANDSYLFGVLVPEAGDAAMMAGAYRTGRDVLLPAALSAKPVENLQSGEIKTWSWQQVLTPGWSTGESPKVGGRREVQPEPVKARDRRTPDVCSQAQALGLECVNPREWRNQTLLALSGLTLLLLLSWVVFLLYKHRQRLTRIRDFNEQRREGHF